METNKDNTFLKEDLKWIREDELISQKFQEKQTKKKKYEEYVKSREAEWKKLKSTDVGYLGGLNCIMSGKGQIEEAKEWIDFFIKLKGIKFFSSQP